MRSMKKIEYFEESVEVKIEGASLLYLILSRNMSCDKRAVTRYVTRFSLRAARAIE